MIVLWISQVMMDLMVECMMSGGPPNTAAYFSFSLQCNLMCWSGPPAELLVTLQSIRRK